jgi:uncharacterized cupredoxin-like copper-binding protein
MKSIYVATTCAAFVLMAALSASSAFAHGDEDNAKKEANHAAEIGQPGDPAKVTRTVTVDMKDTMRFTPATIRVKTGDTVKFVVKNSGNLKHEMVLGSPKELKAHAELMRKFPEMEHADPNQASADPGKTNEMVWRFTRAGTFTFACLQPGHYEAGMVGKVIVEGRSSAQ